jgi:hypothetical protein
MDTEVAIILGNLPPQRISHMALEFARRLISVNLANLLALRKELQ